MSLMALVGDDGSSEVRSRECDVLSLRPEFTDIAFCAF